jgi:ATP-dependent exoDNAse (exonuclease V) alpha subunit
MMNKSLPTVAMLTIGCALLVSGANAQSPAQDASHSSQAPSPSSSSPAPTANGSVTAPDAKSSTRVVPYRYRTHPVPKRAREYYSLVWGVEDFSVKAVESGEIIRFSYRVLDADKAKMLNDKKNEPSLIDPQAGIRLVVPTLEKVGQLRQSTSPEAGKVYWMAFSNKGRYVKPGHRINIVIGNFRADGLIVR